MLCVIPSDLQGTAAQTLKGYIDFYKQLMLNVKLISIEFWKVVGPLFPLPTVFGAEEFPAHLSGFSISLLD